MLRESPACPRCGHPDGLWPLRDRDVYICDACDLEITAQELLELPPEPDDEEDME